jgi:hypothetical protein
LGKVNAQPLAGAFGKQAAQIMKGNLHKRIW